MQNDQSQEDTGLKSIEYHPSNVSFAVSEHIAKENPIYTRVMVYALFIILCAAFVYSYFAKVAVFVDAQGQLEFETPATRVFTQHDIVVETIFVLDNQNVQKGDLILKAQNQLSITNIKKLFEDQNRFNEILKKTSQNKCHQVCILELDLLMQRSFAFMPKLKVDGQLLNYLSSVNKIGSDLLLTLKEYSKMPKALAGLQSQIKQHLGRIRLIEKKGATKLLKFEYNQLKSELAQFEAQLDEKKQSYIRQVQSNRDLALVTLAEFKKNISDYIESHEIRSPASGVVVFSNLRTKGEFVSSRTEVFSVIPTNSLLKAKIMLSNQDISKVKPKDKVKMNLHALPEREYKALHGNIDRISISPVQTQNNVITSYEAWVKLEQQSFQSNQGQVMAFKNGMTLDAKVITKYESLFMLGVKKILNLYDQHVRWR